MATFSNTQNLFIESYLSRHLTDFFHFFSTLHELDYLKTAEVVLILLAIFPGTGPSERSYLKLEKTCYNGWYNYNNGIMLLLIFTFSSTLKHYEGINGLHKTFFEVLQRSAKIRRTT